MSRRTPNRRTSTASVCGGPLCVHSEETLVLRGLLSLPSARFTHPMFRFGRRTAPPRTFPGICPSRHAARTGRCKTHRTPRLFSRG